MICDHIKSTNGILLSYTSATDGLGSANIGQRFKHRPSFNVCVLCIIKETTDAEVHRRIMNSASKSYSLDLIATDVLNSILIY